MATKISVANQSVAMISSLSLSLTPSRKLASYLFIPLFIYIRPVRFHLDFWMEREGRNSATRTLIAKELKRMRMFYLDFDLVHFRSIFFSSPLAKRLSRFCNPSIFYFVIKLFLFSSYARTSSVPVC